MRVEDERATWTRERNESDATIAELRSQLAKCQTDGELAKQTIKELEDRCKRMERHKASTQKAHDDLVAVYERRLKEQQERLEEYQTNAMKSQADTDQQLDELRHENSELKRQLEECQDRLEIVRTRLSDSTTKMTNGNVDTDSQRKPSGLSQLLQEYEEKEGKHWSDMFTDFFKLREELSNTKRLNDNFIKMNEDLVRHTKRVELARATVEEELARLRDTTNGNETKWQKTVADYEASKRRVGFFDLFICCLQYLI